MAFALSTFWYVIIISKRSVCVCCWSTWCLFWFKWTFDSLLLVKCLCWYQCTYLRFVERDNEIMLVINISHRCFEWPQTHWYCNNTIFFQATLFFLQHGVKMRRCACHEESFSPKVFAGQAIERVYVNMWRPAMAHTLRPTQINITLRTAWSWQLAQVRSTRLDQTKRSKSFVQFVCF